MSTIGLIGLSIAFAAVVLSVICLVPENLRLRKQKAKSTQTLVRLGHRAVLASAIALSLCIGVLVFCFMTGNMTIEYVLHQHSDASGSLAWFYRLSALWAGRQGSLLLWAWIIAIFNSVVAVRNLKKLHKLDAAALFVAQLVLAAFLCVLLFSDSNMPFKPTPERYFNSDGTLTFSASMLGMNALLEHWAMAIHPPTLFIGYAGLTIPFAYAAAALIVNDLSKTWVVRSQRYALISWLFLGIGIGLGSIWAYVVLGWGGYWGWDPVENASLLSWLVGLALIHSFTVYRQRDRFKRWSIMCACITFAFVIVGTFISRSGLVQSVHAFEGDPVSPVLFGILILASLLVGVAGLFIRRKSFPADGADGSELDSIASKDTAYYFNNVIMVIFATLLAYLTISSALPSWMPFGGQTINAATYNAIARPVGIFYLAILAVCPLLAWGKTNAKRFLHQARLPFLCALALFIPLMIYFATYLVPAYQSMIAAGDMHAQNLASEGPAWYYNGLAAVGFLVACVLFFNALFMLVRIVGAYGKEYQVGGFKALRGAIVHRCERFGGFLSHFAMSIILIGLIGSSMYVTEKVAYVPYDGKTDTVSEDFTIQDFTLRYTGNEAALQENKDDMLYTVGFDVYQADRYVGSVNPAVQVVQSTHQQKLLASVISFPTRDLFVVYRGVNHAGDFAMDVRVNPLISFVWVGFFLLMLGVLISAVGKRTIPGNKQEKPLVKTQE